jgi:hypothetical protein
MKSESEYRSTCTRIRCTDMYRKRSRHYCQNRIYVGTIQQAQSQCKMVYYESEQERLHARGRIRYEVPRRDPNRNRSFPAGPINPRDGFPSKPQRQTQINELDLPLEITHKSKSRLCSCVVVHRSIVFGSSVRKSQWRAALLWRRPGGGRTTPVG